MRLYIKLIALIAITLAIHHYATIGKELNEVWFGVRCDYANVVKDDQMIEGLIVEAGQRAQARIRELEQRVNAAGGG